MSQELYCIGTAARRQEQQKKRSDLRGLAAEEQGEALRSQHVWSKELSPRAPDRQRLRGVKKGAALQQRSGQVSTARAVEQP